MSLSGIDPESLSLVLQLQLDDLASLAGTFPEGERSDLELAIGLYKNELEAQQRVASDRSMSESIAQASPDHADLIGTNHNPPEAHAPAPDGADPFETTPARDSPRDNGEDPRRVVAASPNANNEALPTITALNPLSPAHSSLNQSSTPIPSSPNGKKRNPSPTRDNLQPPKKKALTKECFFCCEERHPSNMAQCPCSHEYCGECLERHFRLSLSDESLFPPRCCNQPIPIDSIRDFLPSDLVDDFLAKKAELETPDRTYCHQPTCSAFIPKDSIDGDLAVCSQCHEKTCAICKCAMHGGDCPEDTATQELLRVAKENGWQRCGACRRIIELKHGCYHITCLCRAQFCYLCGQQWKTCACAQWDEAQLVARANNVVNREVGAQAVPAAVRENLVNTAVEHLRTNHQCRHETWKRVPGCYECDECQEMLPYFIYECEFCYFMACGRCRYNRL